MSLINCGDITLSSIRNSAERCLKLSSSPLQGTLRSGKRRGKKNTFHEAEQGREIQCLDLQMCTENSFISTRSVCCMS